jgi:hypothetical protein
MMADGRHRETKHGDGVLAGDGSSTGAPRPVQMTASSAYFCSPSSWGLTCLMRACSPPYSPEVPATLSIWSAQNLNHGRIKKTGTL